MSALVFSGGGGCWRGLLLIAAVAVLQLGVILALLIQRRWRRALEEDRNRAATECELQRERLAHLTHVSILGQMSGALAHELNQPLTSILSNAQAAQRLLTEEHVDMTEVRQILEDIVSDDKRASELIHRLCEMLKCNWTLG